MRTSRVVIASLIAAAFLIVTGCGPTLLEKNWGRSVETARKSQTLDPQAGQDLAPIEGLDGRSAENALNTKSSAAACDPGAAGSETKIK